MVLLMLLMDTFVHDVAGTGVDTATTTAGTIVVASTKRAFATAAIALLKVAGAVNGYSGY